MTLPSIRRLAFMKNVDSIARFQPSAPLGPSRAQERPSVCNVEECAINHCITLPRETEKNNLFLF